MLKTAGFEETEHTDSATGLIIRVSTTVRKKFREMYPEKFAKMRNFRLNDRIAFFFDQASSGVEHYFKLVQNRDDESGETELAEIRKGGNFYYISAIRGKSVDILTIQSDWNRSVDRKKTQDEAVSDATAFYRNEMNKFANIQSVWPQLYGMLKSPPPGINLGQFPGKLPPMNKIVIDNSPHKDAPGAVGFVSTEDTNNDGILDTIHLSSQKFMSELQRHGIGAGEVVQLNQLPKEKLAALLSAFVEVISHEMGHIKDYRHGEDNPFPGGEGVADAAGRQAVQQISVATNKVYFSQNRRHNMSKLKALVDLANKMDSMGQTKIADKLTSMIEKKAAPMGAMPLPARKMDDSDEALMRAKLPSTKPLDLNRKLEVSPSAPVELDVPELARAEPAPVPVSSPLAKPKTPGAIQFPGDKFTYDYLPEEDMFVVRTYSGTDARGQRAVGAKIGKGNAKAWAILSKYRPEEQLSPLEGRPLLITDSGSLKKDWTEAQAQLRGWINAGESGFGVDFAAGISEYWSKGPQNSLIGHLMSANLSPHWLSVDGTASGKELWAEIYEAFDGKAVPEALRQGSPLNKVLDSYIDKLVRIAEEYAPEYGAERDAEIEARQAEEAARAETVSNVDKYWSDMQTPADDFTLANDKSCDDMKKQASANVKKLEGLFSFPGSLGPFRRE